MDVAVSGTSIESSVLDPVPAHSPLSLGCSSSEIASASVGGSERKCSAGSVREVIQWHHCYGRQSDSETHIEKGEVYLGLQLERDA